MGRANLFRAIVDTPGTACTVIFIEGTPLHQCGAPCYRPSGTQYVVINVQ